MLVLSADQVRELVDPDMLLCSAQEAYASFSGGRAIVPLRGEIHRKEPASSALIMSGLVNNKTLGVKLVGSVDVGRPERNTTCLILVWDARTLTPRGLVSADHLNDERTAAGLAVGTRHLARPDSRTHVLFGTGKLAFPAAVHIAHVLDIRTLIIVGRTPRNAEALVERLKKIDRLSGCDIRCNVLPDEAVAQADVITTLTRSPEPLFNGRCLKSGTHINLAGAMQSHQREMDDEAASRSMFFFDSRQAVFERAGDIILPMKSGAISEKNVAGEIGQVINGQIAGRSDAAQITAFRAMGIATQDLCLAEAILDNAEQRCVGQQVNL